MLCYWVSGSQRFEGHCFCLCGSSCDSQCFEETAFLHVVVTHSPNNTASHYGKSWSLDMPVNVSGHTVIRYVLSLMASTMGS
jgi:hypothetical protein